VNAKNAKKASRQYDLVLWGATGFTGQLVAEYLARKYGVDRDVRWALAGRNRGKLEELRTQLVAIDAKAAQLPILVGDATERASLAKVVADARVVITTVGPYAVHGKEMVAACVEHGTDYVDLTGETNFAREMIDLHHVRAGETGARIVHCCGFDSIPSDLGTLVLQEEMQKRHGVRCAEVKFYMGEASGGISGGTLASMMNLFSVATKDRELRRLMGDPYALNPDRKERGPDGRDQQGPRWDADTKRWTGPFVMAAINTRVVRRSNALLGWKYGRDFRYSECMSFGTGPCGWLTAAGLTAGLGAFAMAATWEPTRKILEKRLPGPGEGPSKEKRDKGFFVVRLLGIGESGRPNGANGANGKDGGAPRLMETVRGQADPGYGETAKMLSEAALCLAKDGLAVGGGVLTPASCMGMRLVDRLRAAGMTFAVEEAPAA
jgi:short subunit dehydrogenase-like uncharacterized protein